jgi:hypothetical protein
MPTTRILLFSALAFTACSSKVTSTVDDELRARVATVTDCLPPHLEKINAILDLAALWRLNDGSNPPDPPGLTWQRQGDGTLDVTFALATFTISAVIAFYSPTGVPQNLTVSTTSLSQAIDDAATELRNLFAGARPFLVAAWNVAGTGVAGSGALTGIIGGSSNQNELEELRTTTATPAGGPPPIADSSIAITAAEVCTLTFRTASLVTDSFPSQSYPAGTVDLTLAKPDTTINARLVFDTTAVARLTVEGIAGRFDVDVETRSVTFVP